MHTVIKRIEARNYKLLRDVGQDMDALNIVIGSNACGKSTFLDVLALARDLVNRGATESVLMRAGKFNELTFQHRGGAIELTVEVWLPESIHKTSGASFARYNVFLTTGENGEVVIADETLWLHFLEQEALSRPVCERRHADEFEDNDMRSGEYALLWDELDGSRHSPVITALLSAEDQSILRALFDPQRNPAGFYVRELLMNAISPIRLNPTQMARPQPVAPGRFRGLSSDGANIAAAIKQLQDHSPDRFEEWLFHIKNVLRDIEYIYPFEQGDQSLGFEVRYEGFPKDEYIKADSLSDGTLRFLGLTLLAFLPSESKVYLVEEPENGIHSPAIESIYKRLSSMSGSQALVATHSPLFLLWSNPSELLLLSRAEDGAAHMIRGNEHSLLKDLQSPLDLPALFESGILSEVLK